MKDWRIPCEHGEFDRHATYERDGIATIRDCPGGSQVTIADLEGLGLRSAAFIEWESNLNLGRIVVPDGWDKALWLDYLAARTEYIVRQLLISIPDFQPVTAET